MGQEQEDIDKKRLLDNSQPAYQQPAPPTYQAPNPYPPQQPYGQQPPYGYPPQQYGQSPPQVYGQPSPYGYQDPMMPHNASVIVGVAPVPVEHRPMVDESFGHQFKHLPSRMGRIFSKPSIATFNDLKLYSSWGMTFFLLFVEVVWAMIMSAISWKIAVNAYNDEINNNIFSSDSVSEAVIGSYIGYAILSALLGFIIMNACFHGVAMCLGGGHHNGQTGSQMFLQLCFLSVLFGLPLEFLSILGFIPWVGVVISIVIFIVRLIFFVITLQSVYNVSTGHAIGIIVCFAVIVFVVVLVLFLTVAATFLGSISLLLH